MINKLDYKHSLSIFGLAIVFIYSGAFLANAIKLLFNFSDDIFFFIATLLTQLSFLLSAVLLLKYFKFDIGSSLTLKTKPKLIHILLIIALTVSLFLFMLPLNNMFTDFLTDIGYVGIDSFFPQASNVIELLFMSIFVALLPAICEEVVFRGVLSRGFNNSLNPIVSCLLGGFFFALMHGSPLQTLHPFAIGVVLTFIMLRTNCIYLPIILHFLNNLIAFTIDNFATDFYLVVADNSLIFILSGLAVTAGLIVAFVLTTTKPQPRLKFDTTSLSQVETIVNKNKNFNQLLIAIALTIGGSILCLSQWILMFVGV